MTSQPTRTLILSSCLVMGVSLIIYFYDRINTSDKKSRKGIRQTVIRKALDRAGQKRQRSSSTMNAIGSQLDRDLLKKQRRKRLIPFMAMKKPMYDNILMKCPQGDVLSTISLKKAHWYIRKNLAEWETADETAIRLLFQPNTKRSIDTEQARLVKYNQSIKHNCCVACGCDKDYRRHYIVPYAYRARFPPEFKTHMPHDVVILCPTCHVRAQTAAQTRMHALEDELRTKWTDPNVDSRHATFLDPTIQTTRSAASALLNRKAQLPSEKVLEYIHVVRDYFDISNNNDSMQVTEEQLQLASQLEPRCPNPHFLSGPDLLERELFQAARERGMDSVIMDFVKEWRCLFLRTVQPQFLPPGWSLDTPVRCESRSSSN